jgi:aminocarboxymuconate-semialdehyde decarboxylase
MSNRREFFRKVAGAAAGIVFVPCSRSIPVPFPVRPGWQGGRRPVTIGGRHIKIVDIHAHCYVTEAWDLAKGHDFGAQLRAEIARAGRLLQATNVEERLQAMDAQGVDVQAIGINPFWYRAKHELAQQIVRLQNEKLAVLCAAHPDRFVALASLALQFPSLAAAQLDHAVRKLGMRGALIGGSVNGQELSNPKFYPFWTKAQELNVLIFIHPQSFPDGQRRFAGNGWLVNLIGNPLETTVALSHLIFEGTLDRFPGLKICAAHGGGYLPSYVGRSDACIEHFPQDCRAVEKRPSEYLKQLYYDSIVFTEEGLRHLMHEVGPSQIVLGTDFPFGWNPNPVDLILRAPDLSDAEREAILGGTAAKLLGIDS